MLDPTLLGLAQVMLVLVLALLHAVAAQARRGAAHRARHAVPETRGVVLDLPAGLLLLTGQVLLAPGLLQVLYCIRVSEALGAGLCVCLDVPRCR